MYFSAADKGQFAAMVYNWPVDNVRLKNWKRIRFLSNLFIFLIVLQNLTKKSKYEPISFLN